jgi:carboxylate-amine ligase
MIRNLDFTNNSQLTMGVELELQLINLHSLNLAMESKDFLRRLEKLECPGELKPEITQSMIEINSSIHSSYPSLLSELKVIRDVIAKEASKTHIGVSGGGVHSFQKWQVQRISDTERFANVSEQYGYLAKQFTIFGQHIHIACDNGDDALYLCHAMARYIPHFIALSAASPFSQGVDTAFDCSRLTVVSAFPLSGTPPWVLEWSEFEKYFSTMYDLGVVKSMKDFYWDIRPKPEYGTVELRICDTPLTVEKAAELAAYAQLLAHWLLEKRPNISNDIYLTYAMNRFRAARYGLSAIIIDPIQNKEITLSEDINQLCYELDSYSHLYNSREALTHIQAAATKKRNGANWLRDCYANLNSLNDTVRAQAKLWMNN